MDVVGSTIVLNGTPCEITLPSFSEPAGTST
jgi:hypothetical protein